MLCYCLLLNEVCILRTRQIAMDFIVNKFEILITLIVSKPLLLYLKGS
jgi:hypothetical protein